MKETPLDLARRMKKLEGDSHESEMVSELLLSLGGQAGSDVKEKENQLLPRLSSISAHHPDMQVQVCCVWEGIYT